MYYTERKHTCAELSSIIGWGIRMDMAFMYLLLITTSYSTSARLERVCMYLLIRLVVPGTGNQKVWVRIWDTRMRDSIPGTRAAVGNLLRL